jgi:hypothetical protein
MEGKMRIALTIVATLLLIGVVSAQVTDYDNVPFAPGFYAQAYPTYTSASKFYNSDGDATDYSESWSKMQFCARPTYYGMFNENHWMVSAVIPLVSDNQPGLDAETGIGDVQLSAAYWVIDEHKTGTYLSVWLWSDIPTGDDEKALGTGQMNIRPGVAFAKEAPQFRVQASAYYNLRMKNSDTEAKPGDELWANASFGYNVNPQFTPGIELQSGWGQDGKLNDVKIADSKAQWFGIGPYFEYQVNPQVGLKLAGLYNAIGTNTPQSIDVQARVTWGF